MLYVNLLLFSYVTWTKKHTISDILSNLLLIFSLALLQFKILHTNFVFSATN